MENTGRIGGEFTVTPSPKFLEARAAVFDRLWNQHLSHISALPERKIKITLPDGTVKEGVAHKTTPYDIAKEISQGLADNVVISKIVITDKSQISNDGIVACDNEEDMEGGAPTANGDTKPIGELWDLNRPLTADCEMTLLKFDDPESKTVGVAIKYLPYRTPLPPVPHSSLYTLLYGRSSGTPPLIFSEQLLKLSMGHTLPLVRHCRSSNYQHESRTLNNVISRLCLH